MKLLVKILSVFFVFVAAVYVCNAINIQGIPRNIVMFLVGVIAFGIIKK